MLKKQQNVVLFTSITTNKIKIVFNISIGNTIPRVNHHGYKFIVISLFMILLKVLRIEKCLVINRLRRLRNFIVGSNKVEVIWNLPV